MRFILFFIPLLTALSVFAASESPVEQDFRAHQSIILDRLQSGGVDSIGPLKFADLRAFMADPKTLVYESADHGFAREERNHGSIESRDTAEWVHDHLGTLIVVSRGDWPASSEIAKQILPLHEFLGPFDVNDHDCGVSCGLWLLSQPGLSAKLTTGEKAQLEWHIGHLAAFGGVTGVGGGGDHRPIEQKAASLQNLANQLAAAVPGPARTKALAALENELDQPFAHFPSTSAAQEPPITKALAERNQKMCRELLKVSPQMAERIFELLQSNGDTLTKQTFKSSVSMIKLCRQMLKQGLPAFEAHD